MTHSTAIFYLFKIYYGSSVAILRAVHALMAIISILILLVFRKKWSLNYSIYVFVILIIPIFFTTWFSQTIYIDSSKKFVPFWPFKLYPFLFAFLVPGPYWINFLILVLFCIEGIVLWFYMDLPNMPNVFMGSEPFVSILFVLISFLLFFFRLRDEKTIRELSHDKANAEFLQKLTQIFLSMRDRSNTPLQVQKLSISILEERHPEDKDLLVPMANSINQLAQMNTFLSRFETRLDGNSDLQGLLSDEEMIELFEKMEKNSSK